jgi:hypothetical protein
MEKPLKFLNLYLIVPFLALGAQSISAMTDSDSAASTDPIATSAPASRHVYTPEQDAKMMGISIDTKQGIDWADSLFTRCRDDAKQRHSQLRQEEQAWQEEYKRTDYTHDYHPEFQKMRYEKGLDACEELFRLAAHNCRRAHVDNVFRAVWNDDALLTRRLPAAEPARVATLKAEKTACEDLAREIAETGDSRLPGALGQWRTQRKLAARLQACAANQQATKPYVRDEIASEAVKAEIQEPILAAYTACEAMTGYITKQAHAHGMADMGDYHIDNCRSHCQYALVNHLKRYNSGGLAALTDKR